MKKISSRQILPHSSLLLFTGCFGGHKYYLIDSERRRFFPSGSNNSLSGSRIALTVGHGHYSTGAFDVGATRGEITEIDLNHRQAE